MRPEMQKLETALLDPACNFIPYFRDLHRACGFNLEPQLQLLFFQLEVPILAEGESKTIQTMLEETPELSQQFLTININEFEKAHPKVHDRFLQLIDEGAFINGAGETVSCRSMIIIVTSNSGAEVYRGQTIGFSPTGDLTAMDKEVDRRLSETFRFEFLNRFDQMVHFHPLCRNHIRTIALREIEQHGQRAGFKQRRLFLDVNESVLDWVTVRG